MRTPRLGNAERISGFGRGSALDDAVARFALAYAAQNARDCEALRRAIAAGRIEAIAG